MQTVTEITSFVILNQFWAYVLLFFGMIFEGEIVLIFAGILTHLGALDLWPSILIAFSGVVIKSFFGYYIGHILNKKFPDSKMFKYLNKKVMNYLPHFFERPFWSIFMSKFIVGINNFTIIFAGYSKLKFKTYLKAEFMSNVIWLSAVVSLGYFFSFAALSITKEIKRFTILIILFVAAFIVIEKLLTFAYELVEEFYHNHIKNQ